MPDGSTHREAVESGSAGQHAQALFRRVLGPHARAFDVEVSAQTQPTEGGDMFEVEAVAGRVSIRANSGVAAAAALRHYLAHACDVHVTWDDDALLLPDPLPELTLATVESPWQWRYHLNFCTFGYSAVYWDWARWEREIDWMALHGVNLPLCLLGQELVWLRTLRAFGVDDARARAHIGGPAFLPWAWMGCVHDHGTPVTDDWLEDRAELAHRVLWRQRQLGMTPVLPGFTGYVPRELATGQAFHVGWMGFDNHAVHPRDPLFRQFGLALLQEQEREYGSDGYYAIDPFIEGAPPDGDENTVADVARAVSHTLREFDPRSVWVLQGWPFTYRSDFWTRDRVESFLGTIPNEQLLALDLWAEHSPAAARSANFAGRPWLWCMLHNLGGRPGMHGDLSVVAVRPGGIAASPAGELLRGVGTTAESLNHDPVLYELFADIAWHGDVADLEHWLRDYVRRRYGREEDRLHEAWRILAAELYSGAEQSGPPVSIVMSRPRADPGLEPNHPLNLTEPRARLDDAESLPHAWKLLIDSAVAGGATAGMRRDLVDVGDEVLTRLAVQYYEDAVAAYLRGDINGFDRAGAALVECFDDIDELASTVPDRLLGAWLARAWHWGGSDAERIRLAGDARRLLTCWVRPGHELQDYAGRHWAGLVSGYYLPRWRLWLQTLRHALSQGVEPDPDRFDADVARFEKGWLRKTDCGPAEPVADTVAVAAAISAKRRRPAGGPEPARAATGHIADVDTLSHHTGRNG